MGLEPVPNGKDTLIGDLKKIAMKYVREQAMARLAIAVPWLFGTWVGWLTNPIAGFIVDSLLSFLLDKTILGLSLIWIAIDVQYDVANADQATKKLKLILANPEEYTAKEIKEAEENFDEKAVQLIRIGMGNL